MRAWLQALLARKIETAVVVSPDEEMHVVMECLLYATARINDVGRGIRACKTHLALHHLDFPIPSDILDQENDPE